MDSDHLLTIGTFSRLVGLTPSALRFYDDCGLLPPASVDVATGYRYYAPDQRDRAVALRDLREVGVPVAEMAGVLAADPDQAAELLRDRLRAAEERLRVARRAVGRILAGHPASHTAGRPAGHPDVAGCVVELDGAELAGAVRQVAGAASRKLGSPLAGVLIEIGADEVTLVATDRYRLATRVLHPQFVSGTARLLVDTDALTQLAGWAGLRPVRLIADGDTATLDRYDEQRLVPLTTADYPDWRLVFDGKDAPVCRTVVDRGRLLDLLAESVDTSQAVLHTGEPAELRVTVPGREDTVLPAVGSGTPLRVAFHPGLLAAVLSAGIGPDALLECTAPDRAVVVRSADQGTFTTLAMPVRLAG